jgi:predicted nucleic acid-binding protein
VRYLLDTTFAIDYLRGNRDATERFERFFSEGDEPYVNDVVLCELAVGMGDPDDPDLVAFTRAVSFVQPSPTFAVLAGTWRRAARARRLTLDLADALIAAAADGLGARLVTRNVRDFALTPVPIETY